MKQFILDELFYWALLLGGGFAIFYLALGHDKFFQVLSDIFVMVTR